MKRFLIPVLALASLTWTATSCSSDNSASSSSATNTPTEATAEHGDHEHMHEAGAEHSGGHIYSCPMHPEVTSDQPGKCPKCGMTLEHTDKAADNGKTYRMDFAATPTQLAAGKPVTLSFQPQIETDTKAPVPLAMLHEKKMHLIIVSKDLSEFFHEHPDFKPSGRYEVPFTFKTGGEYVLFQDYQPEGGAHQLGRQEITVAGTPKAPVKFSKDQMRWQQGEYAAVLAFDKAVRVGQPLALSVNVSRNGQTVTDLDNYLGAKGHMVIISEDTKQYLHVHPQEEGGSNSAIGFHTTFEKPGLYRVFLQFNHGGKIHTSDFTVNVAPAAV
jgi:hypothetical protein